MKGRSLIPILLLLLIVGALVLYMRSSPSRTTSRRPEVVLPLDLKQVIPNTWSVLPDHFGQCDFDNDGEQEWFIAYRYDSEKNKQGSGLFGAVVFDAQVNRVPQEPANQSPYRPAFLIPYKLLPDIYTGKGQGYLGETGITVQFLSETAQSQPCRAREIAIKGFAGGPDPVRFSVFQWQDERVGYRGSHLVGNARIDTAPPLTYTLQVTTYNRLNDRSLLCSVQRYTRPAPLRAGDPPPTVEFAEDPTAATIDFCFYAPSDPVYPEGVVVALLRGYNPEVGGDWQPGGKSYLYGAADSLPPELANLKEENRQPYRILSVTTPGTVEHFPGQGRSFTVSRPATPAPIQETWWQGRERAEVMTEIYLPGQTSGPPRQVRWWLTSLTSERISADLYWRVERVELR